MFSNNTPLGEKKSSRITLCVIIYTVAFNLVLRNEHSMSKVDFSVDLKLSMHIWAVSSLLSQNDCIVSIELHVEKADNTCIQNTCWHGSSVLVESL